MTRNPTPSYRPGETVPVSGQYAVVDRNGQYLGVEVTCVKGEPFPPTRSLNQYGYVLRDGGSGLVQPSRSAP
jgi:hypothetical protein